jgi:hypothetical protein
MRNFDETLTRLPAYSPRDGIGRPEFRMSIFELAQLSHERVVLGVRNLWLIENVILMLVMF